MRSKPALGARLEDIKCHLKISPQKNCSPPLLSNHVWGIWIDLKIDRKYRSQSLCLGREELLFLRFTHSWPRNILFCHEREREKKKLSSEMAYFVVRQESPSTLPGGSRFFFFLIQYSLFSFRNSLLVILRISLWRLKRFGEVNSLRGSPWLSYSFSPYLVLHENREGEQRPGYFHRDSNCSFPVWIREGKMPNAGLGSDQDSN